VADKSRGGCADPKITKPATGEATGVRDVRDEISKISRRQPNDPAERAAFILAKIETVANDPNLDEDEKARIVAELRRALPE
jgi:hypothetical protein